MSQMSFSDFDCAGELKQSRRERVLAEMDHILPWSGLLKLIEPYYPRLTLVENHILYEQWCASLRCVTDSLRAIRRCLPVEIDLDQIKLHLPIMDE